MIYVIETMMPDEGHLMVNSSFVQILLENPERQEVTYLGDAKQGQKIAVLVNHNHLFHYKKIKVQGNPKLYLLPFFICYHLCIILFFLFKTRKGKHQIVITGIFPVTLFFLRKVIKPLFKKSKLKIALHAELEFIESTSKPILKKLGIFLKKALQSRSDKNTTFIVYGESIKRNVLKKGWLKENEIIAINHPYNYKVLEVVPANKDLHVPNKKWKLAIIGNASFAKNAHLVFDLAAKMKDQAGIEISIIGPLTNDMYPYVNQYVNYRKDKEMWNRTEFDLEISKLDYVLFFYDKTLYKFTASGAFFDCIKFAVPILALKNDFFDYNFELLGNIGRQFDTIDEMKDYLLQLCQGLRSADLYGQQQKIKKAKEILSIENITKDYWNKVDTAI